MSAFWNENTERLHILLVEHNHGDINLFREALRELNLSCNLEIAENGPRALELLNERVEQFCCPDLVLLSLNLPGMDGYEVLKRIKSDARTRYIPVVILSSSRATRDVDQAYSYQANGYVPKPHNLDETFATVQRIQAFWRLARVPKHSFMHLQSRI
jgi:CheY-like chemotaxis protein